MVILLLVLVFVLLAALAPSYFSQGPQNLGERDLEECEAHATTGTYTVVSESVTESAGISSTETVTYTTTQVQVCT